MPKTASKPQPKITVSIRSGPASPAVRVAWSKFWRVVAVQAKAQASGEAKK